jgi:DNA-binding Lrp family transcriptional regulator
MATKTDEKLELFLKDIKSGNFSITKISKESGVSREAVSNAIKKRFPNIYLKGLKSSISGSTIDVELDRNEDPKETIDMYIDMGYRYMGATPIKNKKILLFNKGR